MIPIYSDDHMKRSCQFLLKAIFLPGYREHLPLPSFRKLLVRFPFAAVSFVCLFVSLSLCLFVSSHLSLLFARVHLNCQPNVLTASYFLEFGCCTELYFRPTLTPFSTVSFCVAKSGTQLSYCWISVSHVYQAPHSIPHPSSHAHELLFEPWSDFSLDPPLTTRDNNSIIK